MQAEPVFTDAESAVVRERVVLRALRESPAGCDEYTLIKALQQDLASALPAGSLIDPLTLYRCHFLTYNTLYRLRDRLWGEREAHLKISPLTIALEPYASGSDSMSRYDPLRALYLDLEQLQQTQADDVVELLGKFWTRAHAAGHKHQALETLGLTEPVDFAAIKKQYRRLVMQHHPDRGGSDGAVQAINDALQSLADYYGES